MDLALTLWMVVVAAYTAILFEFTRMGWGSGNDDVPKATPSPPTRARVVPLRRPGPVSDSRNDRRRRDGVRLAR
jgi:hypothetical protein